MIYNILRDYKMLNCEVLVRDENGTIYFSPVTIPIYAIYLWRQHLTAQ